MLNRFIKKILVVMAMAAVSSFAALAQSREERKTVDFNSGGDLRINSDRGSVRLIGWERNQVEVYARIVKPEWGSPDFDPRSIEATKIEILGDARSLTVRANFDDVPNKDGRIWNGRVLPEVHFEIHAPRNLNLNLDADRGRVELRGVEGRLMVNTDRSTVKAEDLSGELRLKMDRGSATLTGVRAKLDFYSDRTNAKFFGAQITGDSRLEVDRGDIELTVPRSQGLYVTANRGRRSGFESDFAISTRNFSDDRIEGEINGGGPRLTIRTDRGKARLKQQ